MVHITIVGLKQSQARLVEGQFAGAARFTFLPADRSDTRLPLGTGWVIISRFTGHRWSVAAFGQLPRSRVMFCGGGIVSILRLVDFALQNSEMLNSVA